MPVAIQTPSRLLIVDDNPAIHNDIRKILMSSCARPELDKIESAMFGTDEPGDEKPGYEISDAFQGQEALAMVRQAHLAGQSFDVAIVDMRMPPGWDGVQTIERLWQVDPDLQIVICTAFSDYSWDEVIERLGIQDKLLILKKPFDDCEVSQATRALSVKRKLLNDARCNVALLKDLVAKRTKDLEVAHGESNRLLTAISSALVGYDREGRVTRWNAAAEQLFSIQQDHAIGCELSSLPIEWSDNQTIKRMFDQDIFVENKRLETTLITSCHESLAIDLSCYPVAVDCEVQGGLLLANDITQKRRLEQQLQQAQKLESVGQLAAGIAHEINTPMQYVGDNIQFVQASLKKLEPVLGLLSTFSQTTDEGNQLDLSTLRSSIQGVNLKRLLEHLPKAIHDAQQGVQNVARIVHAMKEFSHPGSETPSPLDLNRILDSTLVVSKSEWKYIAEADCQLDPNLPSVIGFAHELQQVFLNLIVNAAHAVDARRKHDPDFQGKISVKSQYKNNACIASIQDNGCGIPTEIQNRVYDPFFTTKEVGKGTGQGLAIAHQVVVVKHGGKLWFESQPSVGTTFFVELPADRSLAILP